MNRGAWDYNLANSVACSPAIFDSTKSIWLHRRAIHKELNLVKRVPPIPPFYRIYTLYNSKVFFYLGNFVAFSPWRKFDKTDYVMKIEFDDDEDRLLREMDWYMETRVEAYIIQHWRQQLRLHQTIFFGVLIDRMSQLCAIGSIFYNISRPENVKLWLGLGIAGMGFHYFYYKYYSVDPMNSYSVATPTKQYGTWRLEGIHDLTYGGRWAYGNEEYTQLLVNAKKSVGRLTRQRQFCLIAAILIFYRFYLTPDTVVIPRKYIPRPPYPSHPDGTAAGYWLKQTQADPSGTQLLETKSIQDYLSGNVSAIAGLLTTAVAFTLIVQYS